MAHGESIRLRRSRPARPPLWHRRQTLRDSTCLGESDKAKKLKPSSRDESLEEIVITGSHLALPTKQGAVPVQVYTREDIQNSGARRLQNS